MSTQVGLAREGHVARVRFQGEKGIQILSAATREQFGKVLDEIEADEEIHVVVFEAEGRTFIAGADIQELATLNFATGEQVARDGQYLMTRVAGLNAVTIAAVHAACAGGGCELALACDLRMAAESTRIGLPEVGIGIIPGWGGTVRTVRLFGGAVSRRMILTGELFDATEAYRLGIFDSVSHDDEFQAVVDERVQLLLSRGPFASQSVKRLIADFEGSDIQAELSHEAQLFGHCFSGSEALEGLTAFLEKRSPNWDAE
jgi:enoyl-CoA hydratase